MAQRAKIALQDCRVHGESPRSELLIVEGDSASKAVCGLRDAEFQAVLAMQGKPANASKMSPRLLRENALFTELRKGLGYPPGGAVDAAHIIDTSQCRYGRVMLLFDPDADGIHCGALMLIFFYLQFKALLEEGRVGVIRAPLYEISFSESLIHNSPRKVRFAYTDEEYRGVHRELALAGAMQLKTHRVRGLGGMRSELLQRTCIAPETRTCYRLTSADGAAAMAAFGGK